MLSWIETKGRTEVGEKQSSGRMQVCGVIKTVLEHGVNACRLSGTYCHILLSCTLKKTHMPVFQWESHLSFGCGRIQVKNCH